MKKQTHQILMEYFLKIIPEHKKEVFERQRQTDNVVAWIVGIAVGALALIFSNLDKIAFLSLGEVKLVAFFLLCSVISGVVFRAYIYGLESKESELIMGFEGYCYGDSIEFYGPRTIAENHTVEDIAKSLKDDMGLNYDDWLKHSYLDRSFWVDHYNRWAEFWKKSEQDGMYALAKAFSSLIDKSPEETLEILSGKKDNTQTVNSVRILRKICNQSYLSMLIFFGLAIIAIVVGFILP